MDSRVKNAVVSSVLIVLIFVIWLIRDKQTDESLYDEAYKVSLTGNTMGTSYSVKYLDREKRSFKTQIDSLLQSVNQSLSTYEPESEISRFNRNDTIEFKLPFFLPVLQKSLEVYENTYGAFDPTVMPLVNAWGFGPDKTDIPDSITVDSLLSLVGFSNIIFDTTKVWKQKPDVQLDFSALAKGYGVDVIANYLITNGIRNLMVEIGGEVYCQGKNDQEKFWLIGIDNPSPSLSGNWLKAKVRIENRAVATSGNYRNFYTREGKTYAHTISPFTGYPIQQEVLSASVFADNCMTADAYATAFMVLGLEKSKQVLEENPELDAYLLYQDENNNIKSYFTKEIAEYIEEN